VAAARITCIALLRGINVGKAKRLPMADLKALLESQGFTNVRTLLNSGNAVFDAPKPDVVKIRAALEAAIEKRFGFTSATHVLTADTLASVIAADPHGKLARDPSRYLVAFPLASDALERAKEVAAQPWKPEALAIGRHAAYLWCASGILESAMLKAFSRATRDGTTTRNWATLLKIATVSGK
jgi:uncharacterized protein (DUF1697 family)